MVVDVKRNTRVRLSAHVNNGFRHIWTFLDDLDTTYIYGLSLEDKKYFTIRVACVHILFWEFGIDINIICKCLCCIYNGQRSWSDFLERFVQIVPCESCESDSSLAGWGDFNGFV